MDAIIKKVNETPRYDFYCVWFSEYVTGTMQLDKAERLASWLKDKESVTLPQLLKAFGHSGVTLWYASPLKQIM